MEPNTQDHPTLKNLIEAADLTEPELSRQMGVGLRIIGDWKRGVSIPRFDRAIVLARTLGVSLKVLALSMGIDVNGVPDDRSYINNSDD